MKGKRKGNKEKVLKSGLDLRESLSEEEKNAYVSSCRPFCDRVVAYIKGQAGGVVIPCRSCAFFACRSLCKIGSDTVEAAVPSDVLRRNGRSFVETCSRKTPTRWKATSNIDYCSQKLQHDGQVKWLHPFITLVYLLRPAPV